MKINLQELLARYEASIEACQDQGKGIADIRQRIEFNRVCQEHYEQLAIMANIAVSLEKLADVFDVSPDDMSAWEEA